MRHLLLFALLAPFALGCGKKPPPAPPADEPADPKAAAPAEPSEREKLVTALKTARGEKRGEAADELAKLAEADPAVLDALVELLKDKANSGPGKTHPSYMTSTREAAAGALLRSGPKGEEALVQKGLPVLREGLTDTDAAVREHTAYTAGRIGPAARPALGHALQKLCTDPDPHVRAAAFDALRSVGVADVYGLAVLLTNPDPTVRRFAAEIVSTLPDVPADAVGPLTRALDDEDEVIRVAAADGLAAIGPKGGTKHTAAKLTEVIAKTYPEDVDPKKPLPDPGPAVESYWRALVRLGKPAVPATVGLLTHKHPVVRVLALRTLGDLGADAKPEAEAVRKALYDEFANVALEAACTLARLGEPLDDALALVKAALASNSPGVAGAAVEALGRMGPAGKPLTPLALEKLTSPDASARYAAVGLVGTLEPAEAAKAVPELAKLAADPEPLIRRRAGVVLEKLGPAGVPAAAALGKALPEEPDDAVREQFVDALVAMGPGAKPAVASLLPLVTDRSAATALRVKVAGAVVVTDPRSKDVAAALVTAAGDPDPNVRTAVATALGKLDPLPPDALGAVVKLAKSDTSMAVRTAAIRAAAEAGPRAKGAKADLEAIANGSMPGLAQWAKVALAAIDGDVRKAGGTVRAGLSDRNPAVRLASAEALPLVGPAASDVPALLKVAKEGSGPARAAAARALGRVGPGAKDAVGRLTGLLADKEGEVRVAAAEALGRIGPAALPAVPKLREAARTDPLVAPTALKALDRLGARDDGPKP